MGILRLKKHHRDLAERRSWRDPILYSGEYIPPRALYKHCMDQLDRRGVKVVEKSKGKMTTSLSKHLRVHKGWFDKDVYLRAADLCHELVHYRQRDTFGNGWFELRWVSSARTRFALELPGFFEEVAAFNAMGAYRDYSADRLDEIPSRISRQYKLGSMHWPTARSFARRELRRRFAELPKIRGYRPVHR